MRPALRPRPTYANVTATLALFVALGGGAYAAASLPVNSVGTKQLKNNAVVGSKIKNGSLTGRDLSLPSLGKVPAAAVADRAALDKATYKTVTGTAAASTAATAATATCDAGQHVIGGGVRLDPPGIGVVNDSFPDANGTAWTARIGNASNGASAAPLSFAVYAICTAVSSTG